MTDIIAIEFFAKPRRCILRMSAGTGEGGCDELVETSTPYQPAPPPFNTSQVVPMGPEHVLKSAPFYISVDGVAYAAYGTLRDANRAAKAFCGYINGWDEPVTDVRDVHWPAVDGKAVRVIKTEHSFK